jgi:cyclopropane fatty-acyl-phospholipid synthase-like methyltransferase
MDTDTLREYYNETHIDYQVMWQLPVSHGKHAGYHDEDHRTHGSAVENMNRVLADTVDVGPTDTVLDAGCGVGGSTVWLATERDATAAGVDIVPMQLREARKLAAKRSVADATEFVLGDFTTTGFRDDTFDVVWAIESVSHYPEKLEFIEEAARVVDDGGRLVLSDGFRAVDQYTPHERERMDRWLDGWALPNLASVEEFRDGLEDHGFENVQFHEATENVMPSSKRLYYFSRATAPIEKLMLLTGLRTETQKGNRVGARYQYETLKDGLWTYGIFSAER